jgi:hypothetical protein
VRRLGATSRHLATTPHPSYLLVNPYQIDVDTDGRALAWTLSQ